MIRRYLMKGKLPKVLSNIGNTISANVGNTDKHFTSFLSTSNVKSLFMFPTNENEIVSVTKNMKQSMSTGIDGISSNLIKTNNFIRFFSLFTYL